MENSSNSPVRIFFALWPNETERAALTAWQPPLKKLCGGRATPDDRLHNTLVFLGEVEAERLEALKLAAQEISGAAFQLEFDTAKYWGHNHILYAAPGSVPPKLALLVNALEQVLLRHHFKIDRREYKPHVTLLRHAHCRNSTLPEMPPVVWNMHDFVLVKSVSAGQGVRYEVLERFPLAE
ncbi:MAG: 2'-5' RNA ligase [Gallionellales bacterium 35-53-114]|jgi:2'-5' RNA ligase|nr:MAG: 2'-5' RNA ligase [Gallionellales bacterium 35-53-114]OYZ63873.1 MAG: 2'-5' RNA ligase [Gallionellales bacterium 24-53-125]OZB09296.1 MAG: 2'-5' RNA ligase [Gallionellales bacterium 39-52-133]HQS59091.1 RNA 2',3'-cyclic phosphodiesterase [Gallionellaceae bacterium]HQS75827.1 RNA 2',3'-cyclic phosphodiesterase [Gallionellaceae bacterium]